MRIFSRNPDLQIFKPSNLQTYRSIMSIRNFFRTLTASGLVLSSALAFSPLAFAATDSSGNQQGEMQPIESIGYTPSAKFNLTPGVVMTDQDFGSVNVRSNSNTGWKLEVASTKGGLLEHATLTGTTIAYTLKVAGTSVDVSTPAAKAEAKNVTALTCAATGGCNYTVLGSIAASASDGKPSGTYQDTLTFTLTNQ
jgi:hypothetical protein